MYAMYATVVAGSGVVSVLLLVGVVGATGGRDDVTDGLGRTFRGVEAPAASGEGFKVVAHALELADTLGELVGVSLDETEDVRARCFAAFAEGDDLADLAEGEADGSSSAGEGEAVEDRVEVVAVAVGFAPRLVEDADLFVVADRLDREPRTARDLTDAHAPMIGP